MIETVDCGALTLALILRAGIGADGIRFFTADGDTQQLGQMRRPAGHVIPPHVHRPVAREVLFTQETLFIRSGRVRIDFYDEGQRYLESRIVVAGDVVLLARGGHGFEMLEEADIVEVKQGPYAGEADKIRFAPVVAEEVKLVEVKG